MSTPRELLLGTKTASIPSVEYGRSYFSQYFPNNDTFDHDKNHLQVGIRPSWVLQAREPTEIQSILLNQIRILREGDEIKINTPFTETDATSNLIQYGGVRAGWSNPNRFFTSYEVTRDFLNDVPDYIVDKYNEIYGPIRVGNPNQNTSCYPPTEHGGVGDWLKSETNNKRTTAYPNFKDFKRITFGPGTFYATAKYGEFPYLATIEEPHGLTLDLCGWWPSSKEYAKSSISPYCTGSAFRDFVDPDGILDSNGNIIHGSDGNYPPNEYNANGSASVGGYEHGIVGDSGYEEAAELLEQFPDITYIVGISVRESLVKPGTSSKTDRLLLDNSAGYTNHEAPGAYRVKYEIEGVNYIPVFTGELAPRAVDLFRGFKNFPWDGDFGDRWTEIYEKLLSGNIDQIQDGQSEAYNFILELGFEPKDGDENESIETRRVVMYRYPSVEDYYKIFKKYGIRTNFNIPSHLDDRETNRLKLNGNSVVWDYRLVDPEYLKDGNYLPEDPSIGNGLIETYGQSNESLFGFALGTNTTLYETIFEAPSTTECGETRYLYFSPRDPMYIPYVSTSKYGIVADACSGDEKGPFTDNQMPQTIADIRELSSLALSTSIQNNFIPMIHFSFNQWDNAKTLLYDSQITEGVFDLREIRFIIPPAPNWDFKYPDDFEGSSFEHFVYSTPFNELLPRDRFDVGFYFTESPPESNYSWGL